MSGTTPDRFQTIHNPYIVGNPIKDRGMFFGREDDFTFIRQKVTGDKGGGLLVLCGTRRSGKTSILFQIMNGRLGEAFFPVLIDMQAMAVESDLDFLVKLANGIIDAIGDPEISLEKDFLARRSEGSLAAFESLIVKVNERLGGKKLVILFDEYEIFESHIAKSLISVDVLNLFANWIEHKEGVFIVFTGSDRLEERTAEYWGHFLGKALHRRISFLSRSDTLRLIREPVKDAVRFEDGLPERIYELTAGQPFYTQVFCQALIDHLNETEKYDLADDDLRGVIGQVIENPLPQMIFSWNSLGNLEKLTLSMIGELNKETITPVGARDILAFAEGERIGVKIEVNALNETLEKLFHHDMLNKTETGDAYTFKMDLWRRWTARMHSIWQVIDEIKGSEDGLGPGIALAGTAKRGQRAVVLAVAGAVVIAGVLFYSGFRTLRDKPTILSAMAVDSTQVSIRTVPEGADVFLGRQRIGKSPIENQTVAAVTAPLRIEFTGYHAYVDTLTLRADVPVERSITLAEETGDLFVTSSPPGAQVYLDPPDGFEKNASKWVTPARVTDLSVNRSYDIAVSMAGFNAAWQRGVRVAVDSTRSIHIDLAVSRDPVQITSDPPGASIEIDGRASGVTPLLHPLTYGVHTLTISLSGYEPVEREVRVPLPDNTVRFVLDKLPKGTLVIRVEPWADIYIDGTMRKEQGVRFEGLLEPGPHTIRLENPYFEVMSEVIDVPSNDVIERSYVLTTTRSQ